MTIINLVTWLMRMGDDAGRGEAVVVVVVIVVVVGVAL